MRVLVEHNENINSLITHYQADSQMLGKHYTLLDIHEKYLRQLNAAVTYVEPNFKIILNTVQEADVLSFKEQDIILAVISRKINSSQISRYYDMADGTMMQSEGIGDGQQLLFINCFSEAETIDAISYIDCIRALCRLSEEMNKTLLVYASVYIPRAAYRYRSLCCKIINSYLKAVNGLWVTKCSKREIHHYYNVLQKAYEPYEDACIYLEDDMHAAVSRIISHPKYSSIFKIHSEAADKNRLKRQEISLYDDVFYQSIQPDEEIYVLLNPGNYRKPEYYIGLGLNAVPIVNDYSILYGRKSQFDVLSSVLREEVAPGYNMPIASHIFCYRDPMPSASLGELVPGDLPYKGEGVLIGIVTVDDVDYTNEVLRYPDGSSRIACIWNQQRAGEGIYYFKEQINNALMSPDPKQVVPLPEGDSMSTMMLAIAGGESIGTRYRGVASQAEFIAAKINPASPGIQSIYGGTPTDHGVTMPDVLIGAVRLIEFANIQRRPLVLCIPFNSNIDPHDGSYILNQILGFMAQRNYLTIIAPAGEEADKLHHYSITGRQQGTNIINIRVEKEEQNVVGIIYQRFAEILTAFLYPPAISGAEPINLKIPGIIRMGTTTIFNNGEKINFQNGAKNLLFRLDNPSVGGWRIELNLLSQNLTQADLWLAQQELNPYTTIRPPDPFKTVGSTAASSPLMSVGSFDREGMVVLRSSGRGYSWDNRVQPLLVTNARSILAPCRINEWVSISGTMPAAGIMTGVAANLFSKFLAERVFPFPNTLVINTIILGALQQFEGREYPNPSEGYGIFNLAILRELLAMPLI